MLGILVPGLKMGASPVTVVSTLTSKLGTSNSQFANIVFGGSATVTNVFTENISETLTLSETLTTAPIPFTRNISETLVLTESLTTNTVRNRDITEAIVLAETLAGGLPQVFDLVINDHLEIGEYITSANVFNRSINESITLLESAEIRLPQIFNLTIHENINIVQSLPINKTVQKNITEPLIIIQAITRGASKRSLINENIVLHEHLFNEKVKPLPISEILSLTESLTYQKITIANISETLELAETVTRSATFNLDIHETINLVGGMVKTLELGDIDYHINEAEVVKVSKKCFVVLECMATSSSIVLPCPEVGDSEKNLNTQVIKRSMNNNLYTYIRKNNLQQLTYLFVLGTIIKDNLSYFLELNIGNIINLTNWKGELWKVNISNNPIEFSAKGRHLNEGERWEVTLEFQGVKVQG